jgi:hypothetical protein
MICHHIIHDGEWELEDAWHLGGNRRRSYAILVICNMIL